MNIFLFDFDGLVLQGLSQFFRVFFVLDTSHHSLDHAAKLNGSPYAHPANGCPFAYFPFGSKGFLVFLVERGVCLVIFLLEILIEHV